MMNIIKICVPNSLWQASGIKVYWASILPIFRLRSNSLHTLQNYLERGTIWYLRLILKGNIAANVTIKIDRVGSDMHTFLVNRELVVEIPFLLFSCRKLSISTVTIRDLAPDTSPTLSAITPQLPQLPFYDCQSHQDKPIVCGRSNSTGSGLASSASLIIFPSISLNSSSMLRSHIVRFTFTTGHKHAK